MVVVDELIEVECEAIGELRTMRASRTLMVIQTLAEDLVWRSSDDVTNELIVEKDTSQSLFQTSKRP